MPERESDHLTPATRLLEKRREMTEVELALATQKEVRAKLPRNQYFFILYCSESSSPRFKMAVNCVSVLQEFQMKMETLQQRRDELERKEQQLKESLLKFDKFFKVG